MTTFNFSDRDRPTIEKAASALLDYTWDWSAWLGTDTISSHTVTVDSGLTVASSTVQGNNKVVVFLSGGGSQTGVVKRATCKITTANGRTDERSIYLKIVQR